MNGASEGARLVYVDWLRFLAVIGVILIHVSSVFNPFDDWHIQNAERSRAIGEIAVLMAPWIMPLFMLLAGVSAWYSLRHRANWAYARERTVHLLVPLVAGTLVLVLPQVWLERRFDGQFNGSLLAFVPHFFQGIYPEGNLSWHHLWFLAHLYAYSLIALPLFRYWQRPGEASRLATIASLLERPFGLIVLAFPLIAERQILWGLFPERHMLTADWSNHALLFVAYVYGFILAGEPRLGAAIDAQWHRALAGAVVTIGLLMLGTWFGFVPTRIPPPYSLVYLAFWTVYAFAAWTCMVAVLGAGRRWLTMSNAVLEYGRTVSLGWYLLHHGIVIGLAYYIVRWNVGVHEKFFALLVLTFAGTIVSTELLRRVPGVRVLFGLSPIVGTGSARDAAPPPGPPSPHVVDSAERT